MHAQSDADNVLTIPPAPLPATPADPQLLALEEIIVTPYDSDLPATQQAEAGASPALNEPGKDASSSQTRTPATHVRPASRAASNDRYSFGVQLLRLSPTWLLVGGLAFVSLIVLCNWIINPQGRAGSRASQGTPRNEAANRGGPEAAVKSAAANQQPAGRAADEPIAPAPARAEAGKQEVKPAAETKATAEAQSAEASKSVEASKAASEVSSLQALIREDGRYTIQIGSFPDMAQAQERVNRLKAAGFDGRVVAAEIPNRGVWYRVQAGRFAGRDEASRYGSQIRARKVADSALVTEVGGK